MDNCGFILIDYFKMNVDGIYVIGDVIYGFMFVYKVEDEVSVVVEVIVG